MTVSTLDIILFNAVSFLGGIFTGMYAGIRLRNTMLKSRSRDNLSLPSGPGGVTSSGFYPPIVASAPFDVEDHPKRNEIVIRTTE